MGDPMLPAGSCDRSGGFNIDTSELIEFLSQKDYQCIVITNQSEEAPAPYEKINRNIQLFRVSLNGADQNRQDELLRQASFVAKQILELLDRLQFQPAFIHSYYWLSGYIACTLSAELGIPFVHSVVALSRDKEIADAQSDYHIQRQCEFYFLPRARYIFSITDAERETLCSGYPVSAKQVLVVGREIPAAYQAPVHNELGLARGLDAALPLKCFPNRLPSTDWWNSGAFTYVGRPKAEKGIPYIIEAWLRLYQIYGEKTPPLWIVGGDVNGIERLRASLHPRFPNMPLHERALRVCWWGHLNEEGISALYLKTLALITHSQYEAGGRVIIEAMSQAIPVIATPTGFAKDLIVDWYNGFLVDYADISRLCRRMALFAAQPLLSNSLGLAARETISTARNRWNGYCRIEQVYQAVLQGASDLPRNEMPPHLQSTVDYFACGMLSTYPYAYDRVLCEDENRYVQCLPSPDETVSKALCAWTRRVQHKNAPALSLRFYSKLNQAKLWNPQAKAEAVSARDRYHRALRSCESDVVLPALTRYDPACLLTVSCHPFLSADELRRNGKAVLALLARFSQTPSPAKGLFRSNRYGPEATGWDSMYSELLKQISVMSVSADLVSRLESLHSACQTKTVPFAVWNYGAELAEHVRKTEDSSLILMPSSELFLGEAGYDAGQFLHSYFGDSWEKDEGVQLAAYAANCYHVETRNILKWTLLVSLEHFLQGTVMDIPAQAEGSLRQIKILLRLLSSP